MLTFVFDQGIQTFSHPQITLPYHYPAYLRTTPLRLHVPILTDFCLPASKAALSFSFHLSLNLSLVASI